MGRLARAIATLGWSWLALAACSTETDRSSACYPGDTRDCACPGGVVGWQRCSTDGTAYSAPDAGGECNCSGERPSACVAGAPIVCDPANGPLPFMCPCATDDECDTHKCGVFPAKGNHCTRPCAAATASLDCPTPSCACNNQGVCKAP